MRPARYDALTHIPARLKATLRGERVRKMILGPRRRETPFEVRGGIEAVCRNGLLPQSDIRVNTAACKRGSLSLILRC